MVVLFETNKKPADKQKLRGGYYTPIKLANYLVHWAIRSGNERILEPSAGDGNFIAAILKHCPQASITAIEIDPEEIQKAQSRNHHPIRWINDDFFAVYNTLQHGDKFDVVLGNPPFIRFQYFADDSREQAFKHLRSAGYKPTKLANAWVAFAQLSIELLKDNGRLALVIPAELLQVKYASELRARLSKQFEHIVLIGFKKLVFPEIQQEIVLLLAEGKRPTSALTSVIHTLEFDDGDQLISHGNLNSAIAHTPAKHSRNGMKWTALWLKSRSFEALDEAEQSKNLTPLGTLAAVDVGIVTGRNKFFVLTSEQQAKLSAHEFTVPIIGRTSALTSIAFKNSDFEAYQSIHPAYLLHLAGKSDLPPTLIDYLKNGEQEEVHTGYKCRIRSRWYDVPSVYFPDAFLFRQIHKYPLLVVNEAQAASTDTIHRVRVKPGINTKLLAATFYNSLTLAWSEVCGRSYGGGVLELEPREAEELPIPYSVKNELDIEKVDTLLRQHQDQEALQYVDQIVLKDFLGFDDLMIQNVRQAWIELRNRRINRR